MNPSAAVVRVDTKNGPAHSRGTLDQLLVARSLAHRTVAVVRTGLGLALAYHAIALPAALAGLLSLVCAAVAMTVSSLLVLANAARA